MIWFGGSTTDRVAAVRRTRDDWFGSTIDLPARCSTSRSIAEAAQRLFPIAYPGTHEGVDQTLDMLFDWFTSPVGCQIIWPEVRWTDDIIEVIVSYVDAAVAPDRLVIGVVDVLDPSVVKQHLTPLTAEPGLCFSLECNAVCRDRPDG